MVFTTQYFTVAGLYSNGSITITEERLRLLDNAVAPTFLIILFSSTLSFSGIHTILRTWSKQYVKEISTFNGLFTNSNYKIRFRNIIAKSVSNGFARKIFWAAAFFYIIVFLLTSNTIVYRPDSPFSNIYGVTIPSLLVIGCCGPPGSFPVITIYATDELGFLNAQYHYSFIFSFSCRS